MKIAILTSPNQWFEPFAENFSKMLGSVPLYKNHFDISEHFDILFILSYHKIIEKETLSMNLHNIVVHDSALPAGKGWSPLFWQILEGKYSIPVTLFDVNEKIDGGDIYLQKTLNFTGFELYHEIRNKQAFFTIEMCKEFLDNYPDILKERKKQEGVESYYPRREAKDSELDVDKTIREQFNLLRIVNNQEFPAFFYMNKQKYILKIEKSN